HRGGGTMKLFNELLTTEDAEDAEERSSQDLPSASSVSSVVQGHRVRIDGHQHFWRYDASQYGWIDDSMAALRRDFMPPDAAPEMARTGFHAGVAVQTRQTREA